jgi:hypothetical protein
LGRDAFAPDCHWNVEVRLHGFIPIALPDGDVTYVNISHVKRIQDHKSLGKATVWIAGDTHPLTVSGEQYAALIMAMENDDDEEDGDFDPNEDLEDDED